MYPNAVIPRMADLTFGTPEYFQTGSDTLPTNDFDFMFGAVIDLDDADHTSAVLWVGDNSIGSAYVFLGFQTTGAGIIQLRRRSGATIENTDIATPGTGLMYIGGICTGSYARCWYNFNVRTTGAITASTANTNSVAAPTWNNVGFGAFTTNSPSFGFNGDILWGAVWQNSYLTTEIAAGGSPDRAEIQYLARGGLPWHVDPGALVHCWMPHNNAQVVDVGSAGSHLSLIGASTYTQVANTFPMMEEVPTNPLILKGAPATTRLLSLRRKAVAA